MAIKRLALACISMVVILATLVTPAAGALAETDTGSVNLPVVDPGSEPVGEKVYTAEGQSPPPALPGPDTGQPVVVPGPGCQPGRPAAAPPQAAEPGGKEVAEPGKAPSPPPTTAPRREPAKPVPRKPSWWSPVLAPGVLASFSTSLMGSPANRTHNIRLAARKISGRVLKPGEVFSFNRAVGPRTRATGFKTAMVIVNRRFVPGIGGGVCQVASTLYNAALDAGMHIIERHPHSLRVKYVPLGRDATVNYGKADLRFQNTRPFQVKVRAEVVGGRLIISLIDISKVQAD